MSNFRLNKWIVVIVVFSFSVFSFIITLNIMPNNYLSLIVSSLGVFASIFHYAEIKASRWMIQIWTIAQFFMIYAKHKGNPKYADIIYDVTQGLRFKVDISFLFAERAYFFGINIFAILLYVIFFKLLIPAKSNIPN